MNDFLFLANVVIRMRKKSFGFGWRDLSQRPKHTTVTLDDTAMRKWRHLSVLKSQKFKSSAWKTQNDVVLEVLYMLWNTDHNLQIAER